MGSRLEDFGGVWVSSKNENFDEFLKACGIGMIQRGMAKAMTTTLDIKISKESKMTVKSKTGPFSREVTFSLGEEIENQTPAGVPVKGSWQKDGNTLVGDFKDSTGKAFVIKRSIENGTIVQWMKSGEVECTRWFDKK